MRISKTIILIFFLIGCSNVNDNFGNNILIPMKIYPTNCINKDCLKKLIALILTLISP